MTPPPFLGTEFPRETTHYLASGAAQIDSGDVEDMAKLVRDKGFGLTAGQQLLLLCNPVECEFVQTWRKGFETRVGGPITKLCPQDIPPRWPAEARTRRPT